MSYLGKLYCVLILNLQLYAWAEKHGKLSIWQGGFRRRLGCNILCFRLMSTIFSQFSKKKGYNKKIQGRTFACFVDF